MKAVVICSIATVALISLLTYFSFFGGCRGKGNHFEACRRELTAICVMSLLSG
jgi:hypothetical protein